MRYTIIPAMVACATASQADFHGYPYSLMFCEKFDAQFMWTARTEIEARWSYIDSYDRGWIEPS